MSKESAANVEKKSTTSEQTSTSTSTSTEGKKEATTQEAASTSNPPGIIEEATSTEAPKEEAAAPAEATKPDEAAAPAEIEPYELELDEASPLSDEEFDEVVQEAERLKLNKEDAEKLIKMREYSHKSSGEIFEKIAQEKVQTMVTSYKAEASLHTVEAKLSTREAIKAFGNTPEFKEMFKDPAMNFNIPLAKFLISVGNKIRGGQDNLPMGGKSGNLGNDGKSELNQAANNFYKDM